MKSDKIIISGARQHNLKNINVTIRRNKLVVITGLSGSGKSTLAFDTLYAEGQRRYVESLSSYARQFLERMEKPDVDLIEGLSPAIAIQQKAASHNPRSTVGTVTEIYDYLRLLFARAGTSYCYQCGQPISSQSIDQIVDKVMSLPDGSRIIILSPVITAQKGTHEKRLKQLKKDGFARVRIDGAILEIEEIGKLDKNKKHTIDVVVDRLIVKKRIENRLADSLELAMSLSEGLVTVDVPGGQPVLFSEKSACITCGISYPDFTPASFSFNSPQGACPKCDGLGSSTEFDPDLIIPNRELSLREGAVAVWAHRNTMHFFEFLDALTEHYGVDIYTPYKDLPNHFKKILLYGSKNERITFYFERSSRRYTYKKRFEGIMPNLQRRYLETESYQSREEIKRYMNFRPCTECAGTKLNKASRSVKIDNLAIFEITALSVAKARRFFKEMNLGGKKAIIAKRIFKEINDRLGFLENVGLSYLTLDRQAYTLSGGESQRIRLATQIGSKLTGVLYVLDEPSIGLHQRDNLRLLATLKQMRDLGNTVLVVEHDEETIRSSDQVIDMGPGAGVKGGQIVFSGAPEALLEEDRSLTGKYLSGKKRIEIPSNRRRGQGKKLIIAGASQNNLKKIDVEFPLGCFTCVTGVSGSGKSTLVLETLYNVLSQRLYHARIQAGTHDHILGLEYIDKVIHIDQSPIGRTPRSNPGTYTGVFTYIRELFSRTAEARMRGYKPGRFSFNVKGGRCEACRGDGIIKIEMHFLPDVYVTCDVCRGKRYNRETLEIRYKGKNIANILDMTVNQSLDFFGKIHKIRQKLQTLVDVGLGYIQIGQSATTLSGGEAQRVKLSRELSKKSTGKTVYILDEPTTGLHTDDIRRLLNVLNRFVETGNTVIVIEHNLDVIKTADHIIDLGPEGGDDGGGIVACGTPEEIASVKQSYTGQFLKKVLP
ncbi:MAG: excinuclease ABC subunit UvrA [Desulfobacterales bacterium]|uniref:UvrABC system protein A n=1 Tax=Candidatus Desulfatibia vada TaxID=2841696 RepID=A0A8J6NRH1_9BACT|nr:excinuclease ABC subunit UvrA [Candidatus Desulfatibia vada]